MESPESVTSGAREGVATLAPAVVAPTCERPGCGQPVPPQKRGGDPRRFCSDPCRKRRWDAACRPRLATPIVPREGSVKDRLLAVMADGKFRTLDELALAVGASAATVSARLRGDAKAAARKRGLQIVRDHLRGNGHVPHRYALKPLAGAAA